MERIPYFSSQLMAYEESMMQISSYVSPPKTIKKVTGCNEVLFMSAPRCHSSPIDVTFKGNRTVTVVPIPGSLVN